MRAKKGYILLLAFSICISFILGTLNGENNIKDIITIKHDKYQVVIRNDWFKKCSAIESVAPKPRTTRTKYDCYGKIVFVDQTQINYESNVKRSR